MSQQQQSQPPIEDLEWEEWDGKSPFLHHCIAGSIAGVAEHTLLFPVDTVKTHMQAYCSSCPNNPINMSNADKATKAVCVGPPTKAGSVAPSTQGMWSTMRNLVQHGNAHGHQAATARQTGTLSLSSKLASNRMDVSTSRGYTRLWRGVQTMTTGCIPAHALYFSSYEFTKDALTTTTTDPITGHSHEHLTTIGASAAGAISTLCHDLVMTPMDTIKQRMQLGHYKNMNHAFRHVLHHEGWNGLYRSFGVTVLTNVPYGMIMVTTNEFLRDVLMNMKARSESESENHSQVLDVQTTMLAGCGAGAVAAGITAPLDRVKTRLQTQAFANVKPIMALHQDAVKPCPKARASVSVQEKLRLPYNGLMDAFGSIVKEEGYVGLWRGLVPRLMTHTPAVAISWTTYETAKRWLS
jgi:solute carrier family 25 iron transporter 28/37